MIKCCDGIKGSLLYSFILLLPVLFTSCEFYNFSHPQPYDQERLYQFPDEFLGRWKANDTFSAEVDFTVPLNGKGGGQFIIENNRGGGNKVGYAEEDSSMYCIYKEFLIIVFENRKKVLAGGWPKLKKDKEFINPPDGFEGQYEIKYDSLNNPVDTVSRYIINGDRIYAKDPDRYLDKGYEYIKVKDTITIRQKDSLYIDLGQNAFLCKLTDSLYVFNINNSILNLGESENWWRLVILELAGNGKFNQWECSSKTAELPCMFYERPSKYDQFYFDCRWSSAEMLRLIKEGYFKKSDNMYRVDK